MIVGGLQSVHPASASGTNSNVGVAFSDSWVACAQVLVKRFPSLKKVSHMDTVEALSVCQQPRLLWNIAIWVRYSTVVLCRDSKECNDMCYSPSPLML